MVGAHSVVRIFAGPLQVLEAQQHNGSDELWLPSNKVNTERPPAQNMFRDVALFI
jgi:hypothetical protein